MNVNIEEETTRDESVKFDSELTMSKEDQITSEMENIRLSERSCRFVSNESRGKSGKTLSKLTKNRHPTDPLPSDWRGSASDKKMSLSTSDSYLANNVSASSSYERINKKKTCSVGGSSVNIPVAFPSAQSNETIDDGNKASTAKATEAGSSGAKGPRGQRTPKKEAAKGFETYMMLDQVQQGLKKGELIEGVLRVNPKNYQDAYISVPGKQMDIYLGGIVDRNRALNGDMVVVQLKPMKDWRILLGDLRNYLIRNNLVAINHLMPKFSSSPKKQKLPFKATTYNTNAKIESPETVGSDKVCETEIKNEDTVKMHTSKKKKSRSKGLQKKEMVKLSDIEIENVLHELVDVCQVKENEKKGGKRSRRSKRKFKCANPEVVAHDDAQVPCEIELKDCELQSSSPLPHAVNDVEIEANNERLKETLPSQLSCLNLGKSDKDEVSTSKHVDDLIDFSETSPTSLCDVEEFNIAFSTDDDTVKMTHIESEDTFAVLGEKIESLNNIEEYLDDVYYPNLLNENVEDSANNLNHEVIKDNFDWTELLSKKRLEELSVEELFAIPNARRFLQSTAKVVYIAKKTHSRMARGHLKALSVKKSETALFQPMDHRFPFLHISASKCPVGFFNDPQQFHDTLFMAKLTDWTKPTYAVGTICYSVGSDGDVAAETSALLLESGVATDEFPSNILDDLPIQFPFNISQRDLVGRRDYRSSCVFTIDPETARDLDDAISCDRSDLEEGVIRVAVHIADVSHFVIPGTKVDTMAGSRSTSVYLVSKVIPMLPRLLCEQLCSLRPSEDRLAFSVEWTIRESDGAILSEWFGRSIIRSCAQLSYDHAQKMIDDENDESLTNAMISSPWSTDDLKERVNMLHGLATKLRRKRVDRGALRLDQSKITFSLGSDGLPEGVGTYQLRDSNRLIEELMILANIAVARRIYKAYPHLAVLRMHPQPVKRALDEVVEMLKPYGIHLDPSTSRSLQGSLTRYDGKDEISFARHQLITHLLTKPMKLANYFCSGTVSDEHQFFHYALSVPLYTHFTSPIRRYPDILVHRLLSSALNDVVLPKDTSRTFLLQQQLSHCNQAKSTAKAVQDKSNEVYLTAYIKKFGSIETDGIVCGVMDQSFDVLLYRMAVVKRVYCDQINTLGKMELDETGGCRKLKLVFNDGIVHVITLFNLVKVMLMISESDGNKVVACLQCVL